MNESRTRKEILVVEDSKLMRKIVLDSLKSAGYGTYEAENGRDGFKSALGVHPDLILLDVVMPIMDGLTMLKLLREDAWGISVPVILLTGETEDKLLTFVDDMNTEYVQKDDKMMEAILTKIRVRLEVNN